MPNNSKFSVEIPNEIIEQAKSGSSDAFEQIYRTYSKSCYLLAWRILGNKTLAQDIVHDVFIKVMNKIHTFQANGYFAGWLRKIVVRESINRIKVEAKIHLISDDDLHNIECTDLFNNNWLSSCHDLEALTCHLSTTSRAVLFLHEVEGYNHKEIALLFNKSESFSKVTLSRAYRTLKKTLTEQE
jgi:RNA polymerase sigma factor (sigma-70 family)